MRMSGDLVTGVTSRCIWEVRLRFNADGIHFGGDGNRVY